MLQRTPLAFLAAALVSLSLTVHAQAASPRVCSGKSVDSTTPEMRAMLAHVTSYRALGPVKVSHVNGMKIESQQFETTLDSGPGAPPTPPAPPSVTVTCSTTGGCITGCALTGCNLITVNGSPACSAVSCVNERGGLPCTSQNAVCNKSETSTPPKSTGTASEEEPQP